MFACKVISAPETGVYAYPKLGQNNFNLSIILHTYFYRHAPSGWHDPRFPNTHCLRQHKVQATDANFIQCLSLFVRQFNI